MDEQKNSAQNIQEAMTTLITNISQYVTQVCQQVLPAITQMYNAIYEQYQQAGAPYGDTQEGCLRWMEEIAEVRRLEAQAERIIEQHQGLAYLRKRLAERKEERATPD